MATTPLLLLFFLNGGTSTSLSTLNQLNPWKSASTMEAGDTHFNFPVPGKIVAAATGQTESSPVAAASPSPAPAPTPSKAVAAAASAMPAAPKILSPAERTEANRREFVRLAEWYDRLKHELGYLRKGDAQAVEAYNAEAAQYQAALQLAKTEEADLARLTARK
jgi:hypothetical protein